LNERREPKKKAKGQGKTYYHVKDINFLAHEPLLETFRALRSYERKIKKAKAKRAYHAVDRLEERKPQYGLDHLVKERYPSFGDALRDFDDPLTLTHLFALLPADKRHGIPVELVQRARALALEFQAYVTTTKSLRKCFISVKGVYYQAVIHGQEITWLTPHALAQTLPEDVDYRVMLTFLEFYLAMMGFVNYKLYRDRSLRYPPLLDTRLEDNAAGIVAVIHDLADAVAEGAARGRVVTAAKKGDAQANATEARMKTLDFSALKGTEDADEEEAARAEKKNASAEDDDSEDDDENRDEDSSDAKMEDAIAIAAGADPSRREDARACASLFKGLVFFLNREVPRDMMVFVIRSFGGDVCWDGEGSPRDEKDGGVTHHVCDRPMRDGDKKPQREYVQPQWVVDCANWRVLIPTSDYAPGKPPPPHLSPFVNAEDEGYTPDYQRTLLRLRAQAEATKAGRSLLEDADEDGAARLLTAEEEAAEEERQYARDLNKETSGVPYSRSLQQGEEGSSDEESDGNEDVEIEGGDEEDDDSDAEDSDADDSDADDSDADDSEENPKKRKKPSKLTQEMAMRTKDITINKRIKAMGEEEEMDAMRHVMLPRKKRELYRAMQLGLAKKEARADELKQRKEKMKQEGKYGHGDGGGETTIEEKPKASAKKQAPKRAPVGKTVKKVKK
jgi:pescadillo protein